ncbi:hypothetical protein D3C81_2298740 [compost metagenome]
MHEVLYGGGHRLVHQFQAGWDDAGRDDVGYGVTSGFDGVEACNDASRKFWLRN